MLGSSSREKKKQNKYLQTTSNSIKTVRISSKVLILVKRVALIVKIQDRRNHLLGVHPESRQKRRSQRRNSTKTMILMKMRGRRFWMSSIWTRTTRAQIALEARASLMPIANIHMMIHFRTKWTSQCTLRSQNSLVMLTKKIIFHLLVINMLSKTTYLKLLIEMKEASRSSQRKWSRSPASSMCRRSKTKRDRTLLYQLREGWCISSCMIKLPLVSMDRRMCSKVCPIV